jgi:hypothetical protein
LIGATLQKVCHSTHCRCGGSYNNRCGPWYDDQPHLSFSGRARREVEEIDEGQETGAADRGTAPPAFSSDGCASIRLQEWHSSNLIALAIMIGTAATLHSGPARQHQQLAADAAQRI